MQRVNPQTSNQITSRSPIYCSRYTNNIYILHIGRGQEKTELKNRAGQNYRGKIAGSRQNIKDYVITHPRLKWRKNCFDRSGFSTVGTP